MSHSWVVLKKNAAPDYLDVETFRIKYKTFGNNKIACLCSEIFTATPINSSLEQYSLRDMDGNESILDATEFTKLFICEEGSMDDETADTTSSIRKCIKRLVIILN